MAGEPRGNIESYTFPDSALVGEEKDWNIILHNNGTAGGYIFPIIENREGNPGDIEYTLDAVPPITLPPGQMSGSLVMRNLNVCEKLNLAEIFGTVKIRFKKAGRYTVRLYGCHWLEKPILDTYVDRVVNVSVPTKKLPLAIGTVAPILFGLTVIGASELKKAKMF